MAKKKFTFVTPPGETVQRELFLVLGNAGTFEEPNFCPMGTRVESSSVEFDFSDEKQIDILGNAWGKAKKPIKTQELDPCPVDAGDEYQKKLIDLFIVDENIPALRNQDLLQVHAYLKDDQGNFFAVRYPSSMVLPTSNGGDGGDDLTMPVKITFGGQRTPGTVKIADAEGKKTYTFTPGIEEE